MVGAQVVSAMKIMITDSNQVEVAEMMLERMRCDESREKVRRGPR